MAMQTTTVPVAMAFISLALITGEMKIMQKELRFQMKANKPAEVPSGTGNVNSAHTSYINGLTPLCAPPMMAIGTANVANVCGRRHSFNEGEERRTYEREREKERERKRKRETKKGNTTKTSK